MRFDVVTIFPEMFKSPFEQGIVGQAIKAGEVRFKTWQLRQWAEDQRQTIDDRPFGGGDGMVMLAEPLKKAIVALKDDGRDDAVAVRHSQRMTGRESDVGGLAEQVEGSARVRQRVIYLSPQGTVLSDDKAKQLVRDYDQLILVCGRYGGVDQRFIDHFVDEEISVGDYVLSGGELAAMVLVDTCARFIPGVVGNSLSPVVETFHENLLEHPQFTKPREWEGDSVPQVLLDGNHQKIDEWRRKERIKRTLWKRPDLVYKSTATREEIIEASGRLEIGKHLAVGLLHHPVYNKTGEIVATNVTNLDIHDIARLCRTYGIDKYYIINPMEENIKFVTRILSHWQQGRGLQYNPCRSDALVNTKLALTLEDALKDWNTPEGKLVVTSAKDTKKGEKWPEKVNYLQLREISLKTPLFLLFGTGYGIADAVIQQASYVLEPIRGRAPDGFNHLSVRSAVSITLDRLFGAC